MILFDTAETDQNSRSLATDVSGLDVVVAEKLDSIRQSLATMLNNMPVSSGRWDVVVAVVDVCVESVRQLTDRSINFPTICCCFCVFVDRLTLLRVPFGVRSSIGCSVNVASNEDELLQHLALRHHEIDVLICSVDFAQNDVACLVLVRQLYPSIQLICTLPLRCGAISLHAPHVF
jgi:hypothetical protein